MQVVHSDLKSQNVLLTRNLEIAKIADAGVARYRQQVDVHGNEDVPSGFPTPHAASPNTPPSTAIRET